MSVVGDSASMLDVHSYGPVPLHSEQLPVSLSCAAQNCQAGFAQEVLPSPLWCHTQVVRELQVPEDWPRGDENHLGLLVNETVQVIPEHHMSVRWLS